MDTIFSHIKKNYLIYVLLIFYIFLYFFRLDYNTLASWDEAWYASIARAMAQSGDFIHMKWNGIPYYDHPPMGFWLMAISYKLFGISEFTTRLPTAVLGVLSGILIFAAGARLTGKKEIGFAASLIMNTSVWYVIRVRSGNLDGQFIFFYILTIFFSLLANKHMKWFPAAGAAFAGLLLTKTLVGISAAPLILYLVAGNTFKNKRNLIFLVSGIIVFLLLVAPWYLISWKTYPDFFQHHFLDIGARGKSIGSYLQLHLEKPFFFIHMGIRKWYYLWLVSFVFIFVHLIINAFRKLFNRQTFIYGFLLLWNCVVLYPFLTSDKTELWHLIPVYLPISFIIAVAFRKMLFFSTWIYVVLFIFLAAIQFKNFYFEVFPSNKYIPDDVAISISAGKYNNKIYLDDDFFPISVYYSNKRILPLYSLEMFGEAKTKDTLVNLFNSDEKNFVVITRSWAVDNLKTIKMPYTVLEKNNSYTILTR